MSVSLDRAMMYVTDLKRSVSFYTLLGLTVLTEDEEVVRLVDTGGNTLVLHVVEQEYERSTRGLRLYFAVPHAAEIVERIRTAHPEVTVLQPVELMPWGRRHAYLLDPDGWELSVYERQEGTL